MQLLTSPWSEAFDEFGRAIRSKAILVAPFIRAEPLEQLKSSLSPDGPPKIDLITNLDARSLFRGLVDTEAIARFSEDISSKEAATVTVWDLRGLHAKTYVADETLAIVTSGNLTWASLNTNSEYGMKVTKPELVRQIIDDIWAYSSPGIEIPLSQLEQITKRTLEAQRVAEFRTAENQAVQHLKQEIDAILLELNGEDIKDEPDYPQLTPGETAHSLFTRTILYLLTAKGPLSTPELYRYISELHPDLCDNSVIRITKSGTRYREPQWKHQVRTATEHFKQVGHHGRWIERVDGKWQLIQ